MARFGFSYRSKEAVKCAHKIRSAFLGVQQYCNSINLYRFKTSISQLTSYWYRRFSLGKGPFNVYFLKILRTRNAAYKSKVSYTLFPSFLSVPAICAGNNLALRVLRASCFSDVKVVGWGFSLIRCKRLKCAKSLL
jgi:hypothetical protein